MNGSNKSGRRSGRVEPLLCALLLLFPAAVACPAVDLEETLGIPLFPGAEQLRLQGPTRELVDLERPGWEFVLADVMVADFLVDAPIAELRRFYRPLTTRDAMLLLVNKDGKPGEIVAVRHTGRHPLHPRKRWLRIVTYRLAAAPAESAVPLYAQPDGE